MDRRTFLKTGAAAGVVSSVNQRALAKANHRRPNLLFVFGDQHRAQSLPGEAFNEVAAPNMEAFRRENFSMDCCISNYPLCAPYRGILLSGRWPQQTGLMFNGDGLKPEEGTLGHTFAHAGYNTGYVGKWHLSGHGEQGFVPPGPQRMGFDYWQVWDVTNEHYHAWTYDQNTGEKITPDGWQPVPMTDEAIGFIKRQSKDKPWFLALSWNPPHPPYNPPTEDKAAYEKKLQFRPNVKFRPDLNVPNEQHYLQTEQTLHEALQGYYGAITGIDQQFGRLLNTLHEMGMEENTIVIYTSDHGDMMGSHGRMAKQIPFEESCRVPFMIRVPGSPAKHGSSNLLFSALDIYPTLCGLAGIPVPKQCEGKDFSGVMRGTTQNDVEHVFLMNQVDEGLNAKEHGPAGGTGHGGTLKFINQPSYRGIRTKTHTYAVAENGRWLLYDNLADPYQMKNLVNDASQNSLMVRLDALVMHWLQSVGDPFPYGENITRVSAFPSS